MKTVGEIELEQVGGQMAEVLGVMYNGVQRDDLELFAGHLFTDLKTKGTFCAKDALEGAKKLETLRQKFGMQ